jgi:serine/threonine protein kinase
MVKHYELAEQIGDGTVGTAYRARNTQTGEIVALKLLKDSFVTDANVQQRFVREVSVLQKLNDDNIVRIDFCGLEGDQLFYTMEFIDSGTLKEALSGSPVPWRDAADLGLQVANALQHAHEKGVIHRDLKPGNLFLSGEGRVKVGDFGIALDTDMPRLTAEGMTVGTVRYMAPEQITADPITPQTDIYALGCILFEMLTGHVPFDAETDVDVIKQHIHAPPPEVTDENPLCPPALGELVSCMLSKEPEERPASAQEVHDRLRALVQSGTAQDATGANGQEAEGEADQEPNLTQRLHRISKATPKEASWTRVAAVFAVIAGLIAALAIFAR